MSYDSAGDRTEGDKVVAVSAPACSPGSAPEPDGDLPRLAPSITRLRRALRRASRVAGPADQPAVAQIELLDCLGEHPGARPSDLARMLQLAPNSVTTLVNSLARLGMLTRHRGTADRRTVRLELTDAGRAAVERWHAVNNAVVDEAFAALAPEDARRVTAALPALVRLTAKIDELARAADEAAGPVGRTAPSRGAARRRG